MRIPYKKNLKINCDVLWVIKMIKISTRERSSKPQNWIWNIASYKDNIDEIIAPKTKGQMVRLVLSAYIIKIIKWKTKKKQIK